MDSRSQIFTEAPYDPPGLLPSVAALVKLFYNPALALETLFAVTWPRFLLPLLSCYLFIPILCNVSARKDHPPKRLYESLGFRLDLTLDEFHTSYLLFLALSPFFFVICAASLQRYLLSRQRETLSIFDSAAIVCYSLFPFFCILLLVYLVQISGAGIVFPMPKILAGKLEIPLTLALIPAALMGLYIWCLGLYMLTELPSAKMIAICSLSVVLPWIMAAVVFVVFSYRNSIPFLGEENLDHLRRSIQGQESGGFEHLKKALKDKRKPDWNEMNYKSDL